MGKKGILRGKRAELKSAEEFSTLEVENPISEAVEQEEAEEVKDRPPVDDVHEEIDNIFRLHEGEGRQVLGQTRSRLRNPVPSTGGEDESPQPGTPTSLALNALGAKRGQGIKVEITPYRKVE